MSQDLRIAKTCRAIRSTYSQLLSEKPASRITISELCELAQINRKTFYRHYSSLADVCAEIETEMLDGFARAFTDGGIDSVGSVVATVGNAIGAKGEYYRKLMSHNPEMFNSGRLKQALTRTIIAVMKNHNSALNEDTLRLSCEFAVSGVLRLYAFWFENGGDWENINALCVKLVQNTLQAE